MEQTELEKWKKAGQIAGEALQFGKSLVKKDVLLLEVADKIEAKIKQLGGMPAFPVNISLNHIAAHYTPSVNDDKRFSDELVKIDVGVHVDGFIGDTAASVDLSGKYADLIKASEQALQNAIKLCKPGATLGEIGAEIQQTINSFEFVPIKNLSGHSMEKNNLHAGITVPNIANKDETKLEEDWIIAIEPFSTTGKGYVEDSSNPEIFRIEQIKNVRSDAGRELLKQTKKYEGLPFCKRWIQMPMFKLNFALKELDNAGILHSYPPLVEAGRGVISQAEHTILVKDKTEILTKLS